MLKTNTPEQPSDNDHPMRHLHALPLANHFLPVASPPLLTGELWRRVFAIGGLESTQERVDALCFYATFALLGLVGFDREHRENFDTLLVPVVFDNDKFSMRLTIHRRADARPVLTFSLPEESVPSFL